MPRPDLLRRVGGEAGLGEDGRHRLSGPPVLRHEQPDLYEPLADGTVRAGFTPWAASLMGEVLVTNRA